MAHVVARLRQLLLRRVGLGLEDQPDEAEPVDLRLGRGQPLVGRVEAGRHVGERRLDALPFGLGLHQLGARRLRGGAGLTDLLLELLLLVGLLAQGAPGEGDGREGHEQERGEGPEPTHAEHSVNNISHMSNISDSRRAEVMGCGEGAEPCSESGTAERIRLEVRCGGSGGAR